MIKKYNIFVIKEEIKNIFVVKIHLFFLIMIFTFSSQSLNHASVSMKQHILKKNGMNGSILMVSTGHKKVSQKMQEKTAPFQTTLATQKQKMSVSYSPDPYINDLKIIYKSTKTPQQNTQNKEKTYSFSDIAATL